MCWVKENLWGPGAASPFCMKVGLPVSIFLNLGIGRTSAGKKKEGGSLEFTSGNVPLSRVPVLSRSTE